MAPWIRLLTAGVHGQPRGDIRAMLISPALSAALGRSLTQARAVADGSLLKAWPVHGSPYRASLAGDINWAYGWVPERLWEAAIAAFESVPPEERAVAVRAAVTRVAWELGLRNELTVAVARTRRSGEEVLAGAEPGAYKKWVSREDDLVCEWCRLLASQPAIPVGQEFSYGSSASWSRQPPRVYMDLLSCPAHPRCRCKLILVRAPGVTLTHPSSAGESWRFMSAESVRAIPEARYQALREFYSAAVHELGKVSEAEL